MNSIFKKACGLFTAAVMAVCAAVVPASAADSAIERQSVPRNEATDFVNDMGAGINLGNTFDAVNCTWLSNDLDYETGWQKAKTTREIIKCIKDAGFTTIRVPVSWSAHVDSSFTVNKAWMDRVAEVIGWCMDEGFYTIINVHHDVLKGYYYPSSAEYSSSEKYMKSVWSQISNRFKDYGEKLIFEIINEPRLTGTNFEWWYDPNNIPDEAKDSLECINKLNQLSLDTIRSSGGNNKTRYVLLGGYDTDGSEKGIQSSLFKMPKDSVKNRLIADVHYYGVGKDASKKLLDQLYTAFVSKGVPVVISEYGLGEGGYKYFELEDTAAGLMGEYYEYARSRGITVVAWDINSDDLNDAKRTQFIDRNNVKVALPKIVNAMVKGGTPAKLSADTAASSETKEETETVRAESVLKLSAKANGTKVVLSWDKVDGATKYAVYQLGSDKKYKAITQNVTKTTYTVSGLEAGKKYTFAFKAYVNGKWSPLSEKASVTINKSSAFTVKTSVSKNSVKLTWSKVDGATKYAVYQYIDGKYKSVASKVTATSYTVKGLDSKKTYKFRVRAYVDGKWVNSDAVSAKTK